MGKEAEFKTGTTAVEFMDKNKVANVDYSVLPAMVNADITDKDKKDNQMTAPAVRSGTRQVRTPGE